MSSSVRRPPSATARLRFRRWRDDDLALAVTLWGDPEVTRYIDARPRLDRAAVARRLAQEIETERRHGYQYWPLFRHDDDRPVGACGLHPRDPAAGVAELGVHLRADARRRGYAREACRAVIVHAFEVLGLRALFAGHHPDNEPSRRLLADLGFVHTHDEPYPPTGREHPSYRLGADASSD